MNDDEIIPAPSGGTSQVNMRWPTTLVAKIEEISKATGHTRTNVVLHLLRWALKQYDVQQRAKMTPEGRRATDAKAAKRGGDIDR